MFGGIQCFRLVDVAHKSQTVEAKGVGIVFDHVLHVVIEEVGIDFIPTNLLGDKMTIRTFLSTNMSTFALFAYFLVFLILLKIRSIKLSRSWFVPLFSLYFGLIAATFFALFLNGEDSSFSGKDSLFTLFLDLIDPINSKGRVMYGGYFGSIIGILIANFISKNKSLSELLDISAVSWSLFLFASRIGCLATGCCYGQKSEVFGISFHAGTVAFRNLQGTDLVVGDATVPLFPTQLVSALGNFAIFLFLLILFCRNKTRYPYFYFFAHALLYGIGRFTIEFFRIDPREFWGPLSMSQWISLVLVAAGLVFFIKNRKEISKQN